MISRRPGKLRRSGFLPPVMQNTSTHTMPARYRRDLGARFKTFRDNPRTFLGAPMPMRRRATRRLRLTMITGTFLFASMIVIIHVPSRALSSAPNDNHPTCTLGRWDARTGYISMGAGSRPHRTGPWSGEGIQRHVNSLTSNLTFRAKFSVEKSHARRPAARIICSACPCSAIEKILSVKRFKVSVEL